MAQAGPRFLRYRLWDRPVPNFGARFGRFVYSGGNFRHHCRQPDSRHVLHSVSVAVRGRVSILIAFRTVERNAFTRNISKFQETDFYSFHALRICALHFFLPFHIVPSHCAVREFHKVNAPSHSHAIWMHPMSLFGVDDVKIKAGTALYRPSSLSRTAAPRIYAPLLSRLPLTALPSKNF